MTDKELERAISFINKHENDVGTQPCIVSIALLKDNHGFTEMDDIEKTNAHNFYVKHKAVCNGGRGSVYLIDMWNCGFTHTYVCETCNESEDITNYNKDNWNVKSKYKLPFSFIEGGTGIGSCIRIVCNKTGDSEDITDYECW